MEEALPPPTKVGGFRAKLMKLIKNKCEIEGCEETEFLHLHHIIPQSEVNTTNHSDNLAILCPNHHAAVHSGKLKIIGIYPSTKLPNNRILVYELNGVKNIDISTPLVSFTPKSFKIFNKED